MFSDYEMELAQQYIEFAPAVTRAQQLFEINEQKAREYVIRGCDKRLILRLCAWCRDFGLHVKILSAYRCSYEQEILYRQSAYRCVRLSNCDSLSRVRAFKKGTTKVCEYPGMSAHNAGMAADIDLIGIPGSALKHLPDYGLLTPPKEEPNHIAIVEAHDLKGFGNLKYAIQKKLPLLIPKNSQ